MPFGLEPLQQAHLGCVRVIAYKGIYMLFACLWELFPGTPSVLVSVMTVAET